MDDQSGYVAPGQEPSWIAVAHWEWPYGEEDEELARVREALEVRLGG